MAAIQAVGVVGGAALASRFSTQNTCENRNKAWLASTCPKQRLRSIGAKAKSGEFLEERRVAMKPHRRDSVRRQAAAIDLEAVGEEPSTSGQTPARLIYMEGNSWMWEIAGVRLLVDPWLEGALDFGVPWLYEAFKKVTKQQTLADLPPLDAILITQSLEDHCHMRTLTALAKLLPDIRVIAPSSAEAKLRDVFQNLTILDHWEHVVVRSKDGAEVEVLGTPGDVVGPPWQKRELGFLVSSKGPKFSLYHEPHCKYDPAISKLQADVVIAPVIRQVLFGYEVVSGQEEAIKLAKVLKAKYAVPMRNGDLDAGGPLHVLLQTKGTVESFQDLASKSGVEVLVPEAGKPLSIPAI